MSFVRRYKKSGRAGQAIEKEGWNKKRAEDEGVEQAKHSEKRVTDA